MSAEAPKNSGQGEPIHPQRPDGGFSGFLKRLFSVPPEPQRIQEETPRIIQSSLELSAFATRINTAVDNGLDMARKAEVEKIEQERKLAELAIREKESQENARRQLIESRLRSLEATKQIAEELKIRDRLAYINDSVWEGKGKLLNLSSEPEDIDQYFGFKLVFSYPSAVEEGVRASKGRSVGYNSRLVPGIAETYLSIAVQNCEEYGARGGLFGLQVDKDGMMIGIRTHVDEANDAYTKGIWSSWWGSSYRPNYVNNISSNNSISWQEKTYRLYPINREDFSLKIKLDQLDNASIEEKLDQILVRESTTRVREGVVPSKLIIQGQERLKQAKTSPSWMIYVYSEEYYDAGD